MKRFLLTTVLVFLCATSLAWAQAPVAPPTENPDATAPTDAQPATSPDLEKAPAEETAPPPDYPQTGEVPPAIPAGDAEQNMPAEAGAEHAAGPVTGEADHAVATGEQGEHAAAASGHHGVAGKELKLWWVIPFIGILLSIALFPLFAPHFWHTHFAKVSAFWALAFAAPFVAIYHGAGVYELLHIYLIDYIPFIILLWGLYTVAGGMIVRGTLRGSPGVNLVLLLIGTVLASWLGTTGASMLLIRPMLRANAWRKNKTHVVIFFIFLVSNIGGSLTPLGDPPLFLGFIHGVDFFWTMNLLPQMSFVVLLLMAVFLGLDSYLYKRETPPPDDGAKEPLKIDGLHNLLFFGGIIGGVLLSGMVKLGAISVGGVQVELQNLARDGVIVLMGVMSLVTTKKQLRTDNEFTWFPIKEVAYLFAGIFATIVPALAILKAGTTGAAAPLIRAVEQPWHFFWVTGILSSFLDNAPTYLTFFTTAIGKLYPAGIAEKLAAQFLMGHPDQIAAYWQQIQGDASMAAYVSQLAQQHGVDPAQATAELLNGFKYLLAISAGAVFMGANTYIGNAPNFMVKSIAEESGVEMPSFFGYMIKYSIPFLVATFLLVTVAFFTGESAINHLVRYGVPVASIAFIAFTLFSNRGGRR